MLKDPFKQTYNLILEQNQNVFDTLKNIKDNIDRILLFTNQEGNLTTYSKEFKNINKFNDLINRISNDLLTHNSSTEQYKDFINFMNFINEQDYTPTWYTYKISENKMKKEIMRLLKHLNNIKLREFFNKLIDSKNRDLVFNSVETIQTDELDYTIFNDIVNRDVGNGQAYLTLLFNNLYFYKDAGCDVTNGTDYFEVKAHGGAIPLTLPGENKKWMTYSQGNIDNLYFLFLHPYSSKKRIEYVIKTQAQVQNFINNIFKDNDYKVQKKNLLGGSDIVDVTTIHSWKEVEDYHIYEKVKSNAQIMIGRNSGGGIKIPWSRFITIE